jgi:hypothetical protein
MTKVCSFPLESCLFLWWLPLVCRSKTQMRAPRKNKVKFCFETVQSMDLASKPNAPKRLTTPPLSLRERYKGKEARFASTDSTKERQFEWLALERCWSRGRRGPEPGWFLRSRPSVLDRRQIFHFNAAEFASKASDFWVFVTIHDSRAVDELGGVVFMLKDCANDASSFRILSHLPFFRFIHLSVHVQHLPRPFQRRITLDHFRPRSIELWLRPAAWASKSLRSRCSIICPINDHGSVIPPVW